MYFYKKVFFIFLVIFIYSLSLNHLRLAELRLFSAQIGQSGMRWKCKWFILFHMFHPVNQSLKSKFISLCFLYNFFVHFSNNSRISSFSFKFKSLSRYTFFFGIINKWFSAYGARAGIIKNFLLSSTTSYGFICKNGSNFFHNVCNASWYFMLKLIL